MKIHVFWKEALPSGEVSAGEAEVDYPTVPAPRVTILVPLLDGSFARVLVTYAELLPVGLKFGALVRGALTSRMDAADAELFKTSTPIGSMRRRKGVRWLLGSPASSDEEKPTPAPPSVRAPDQNVEPSELPEGVRIRYYLPGPSPYSERKFYYRFEKARKQCRGTPETVLWDEENDCPYVGG